MMFDYLKRLHWKPIILSGFVFAIIAMVVHMVESVLTMSYYLMPAYFGTWSKVMMPTAGPPPVSFYVYSSVASFLGGFLFAELYDLIKSQLGATYWQRVCIFTKYLVLLELVIFILPLWLFVNLPLGIIVSWFVSGALIAFLGTMVFAKMMKM